MRTPRITARAAALAVLLGLGAGLAWADSIWDRRIPNGGYLFVDNRARKVGDLLTVLITETTNIQHFEQRNSDKTTKNHWLFSWAGKMTGNVASRISQANADLDNESERMLQGRSQYMANRAFVDHMTVTVVQVLPNGNLVVEGTRGRNLHDETRAMTIRGVVRPFDIGDNNIVESQYIANFQILYKGRGIESAYTQQGWLGKIMNYAWPF